MKTAILYISCLVGLLIIFTSCQERIDIPSDELPPAVVIEGRITNETGFNFVRLSKSEPAFNTSAVSPYINNARVVVTDLTADIEYIFQELRQGYYSHGVFEGTPGNRYSLNVQFEDQHYYSEGLMPKPPQIDTVTYIYKEATLLREEGYYLLFSGKFDKSQIGYYRWQVFTNDSIFNNSSEQLAISDEFLEKEVINYELPYRLVSGDLIRMEMYSVEQAIYTYFTELSSILMSDGGMFSQPPANPTTNITNLNRPGKPPLGYFQVSGIQTREFKIIP